MSKKKIICVVGPTASGKTQLAIALAKHMGGEVISADSMQIYRGMHIASAAPDTDEMQGIPHHLIEFLQPSESFTVADFVTAAREKIDDIVSRGKMPIIAGGTGLYISSLVNNIEFVEAKADSALRERLTAEYDAVGGETMLEKLREIDPEAAAKLHQNDKRRIIRAFEILESTGKTKSFQDEHSRKNESPYSAVMLGTSYRDREKLYERINRRVDIMLENGLLEEARTAYQKGVSGGAQQAIGHKELFDYFKGEKSLEECVENLKRSTRRYAKRQLTWFNRVENIHWIYKDETDDAIRQAIEYAEREENYA